MKNSWLRHAIGITLAIALTTPARSGIDWVSGPLTIGLAPVDLRSDDPNAAQGEPSGKLSNLIARTVGELLPNYIQRVFERGFDRPVSIVRTGPINLAQGTLPSDTPPVVIIPSIVSTGSLGVRVSARIVGFDRRTSRVSYDFEEVLLLAGTSNYGEIDTKLSDFSAAIARRIATTEAGASSQEGARLPRGAAQFYCITATQPENMTLQQLSRTLTLEMPFHLSRAASKRGLDLSIQGLGFKEALGFCAAPGNVNYDALQSLGARVATFHWDGLLNPDPQDSKAAWLSIRVRDSLAAYGDSSGRLKPVKIREGLPNELDEIAPKIIEDFIQTYRPR
ncbi:hypothetical protein IVA98_26080 [Bradyrhizobium sp. 160]|uniref:hypothetical protein n=1 Tax=Bradyrhizobium sp. 160 TaxID=2782634 RepID=UPI001FFA75F6|nr:hypothetical protein [Bradyrhizobium sp. 160]MCK1626565.1 hypothetical protein [Bradyrhizobium sp. 160]